MCDRLRMANNRRDRSIRIVISLLLFLNISAAIAAEPIIINPDVTQQNIHSTICVSGYTATIRPSASYTNRIKKNLLKENNIPLSNIREYELDHIIPLAVGGHPKSLDNLMLQHWEGEDGAKQKDYLERRLHRLVCKQEITLEYARACIFKDWEACARKHPGKPDRKTKRKE